MRTNTEIIKELDNSSALESKYILSKLTDAKIEMCYFEVCENKKLYQNAYNVLLDELNRRKDKSIEVSFAQ